MMNGTLTTRRYTREGWGDWYYDPSNQTLNYQPEGCATELYYVDLDRCTSYAEAWDWVSHIGNKTWATDAVLGGLVRALTELLWIKGIHQ